MDENKTLRDVCQNLPPEVESLSFNSNNLTNLIDLCGLQNLKILDVSQNSIVDSLTYYQFENLILLNLSLNVLKFIRKEEFVSFPNIEILDLSNNNIYYIDQEAFKLENLKFLFLNVNKISYINERIFRFLVNLEFLDLNSNRLSIIPAGNFFYLHNLRRINLSYNKLQNIDRGTFDNLEKIELVDLSFNNFTKTPILGPNLKYFIFDGNPIKILRQYSFENFKLLRKISMRNSSFLNFIAERALNNLSNLHEVSFDNCPDLNYVSKNFAHNSPYLKILSLENCSFRVVPEIFIHNSTLLLKMRGNPLDCRCLFSRKNFFVEHDTECREQNSQKLINITQKTQKCPLTLSPNKNSTTKVILGSTVSLYCAIAAGPMGLTKKLLWTKNGRKLRMIEGKISTSDEKLTFLYTEMNDTGLYGCLLDDSKQNLSRYIFLQVKDPNVGEY
uniref:Ig-like domain-containing protein n=1 Tax=Romanomermis culicivorax TaxID=13658 RepID=A0A915J7I9_ROMCU